MSKPKVFVTRILPAKGLDLISSFTNAEVWKEELPPPEDTLFQKVKGIEGLVCLLSDRIDAELMDQAGGQLRVISQMAVGVDNIDIPAATERGIPVGNTPGVLTETTADFAFALLMAAGRRIVEGERFVKAGNWKTRGPTLLMGHDIHGATLGIVGFGRIGQAVARRAQSFGMRILYYDDRVNKEIGEKLGAEKVALDDLLSESDFVSLHVPMTEVTKHLIGARELQMMKDSAVLINTSRGPVVDSDALYGALTGGEICCVALDVIDPEPISENDPLLSLSNCLIVPHIASSSVATRSKMAIMAAENLKAGLSGERIPYCANPEVYKNG